MKKLIPILLCVLLVAALALSVSAEGSSVALTPSATTLERGDTFTVVANLTNTDPIKLGTVALEYDTNVFELTGGTCHVAGANPALVIPAQKVGTFFLGSETAVSGQIFTFNFKVKADAPLGTYTIKPTAAIGVATGTEISSTGATVTVSCQHSYGSWSERNNEVHKQTCSKCGDVKEEPHNWDDGVGKPAPTCTEPGTIEYTCSICWATKTQSADPLDHAWDSDCDSTCNRGCGETREASHSYPETMTTDVSGHWYECTGCGQAKPGSWAAHTPGAEPTETTAQVCTVCNYEIKPASGHQHVMETEWTTDATHHWHRCEKKNPSCYYVADKAKHDYDNDCDINCNTCGYIREAPHNYNQEWRANTNGHWQNCIDCGAQSRIYEHVPGPEATMDTPQLCTECNFRIKMPLSHEHSFGEAWYSDDASHWQSCSECQESTELELHVWSDGVELENGKMQYTCSVCGHQVQTDGAAPTEPTVPPTTQAPTTQTPAGSSNSGRFPWEWAGLAAIILLVIGILLLVIEFIRSRKTNMHGKFSK